MLDLCTGTGDLAVAAVREQPSASVVGVDFAGEMLRLADRKIAALGLGRSIRVVRGDGMRIPLAGESCDAATIGFGIRNVVEPRAALAELARMLRPGARLAILEFGQPRVPGIKTLYAWYFRYLLPLVGRTVSKHDSAYSYLPASVGTFPPATELPASSRPQDFHRSAPSLSASASSICMSLKSPRRQDQAPRPTAKALATPKSQATFKKAPSRALGVELGNWGLGVPWKLVFWNLGP